MGLINYTTLLLDIIIVQSNLSNVTLSGTIQVTKCCLHELILEFAAFFINCVPTKYFNCFTMYFRILWNFVDDGALRCQIRGCLLQKSVGKRHFGQDSRLCRCQIREVQLYTINKSVMVTQ